MKIKIRLRSGGKIDLPVLDISPIGCMVDRRGWTPQRDDRILVQLENLGFQPATVVWVEGEQAGIELEQLLHEVILDQLKSSLKGSLAHAA